MEDEKARSEEGEDTSALVSQFDSISEALDISDERRADLTARLEWVLRKLELRFTEQEKHPIKLKWEDAAAVFMLILDLTEAVQLQQAQLNLAVLAYKELEAKHSKKGKNLWSPRKSK